MAEAGWPAAGGGDLAGRKEHSSIWREEIGNRNPLVGIDDGQTNVINFIPFVCPSRTPIRGAIEIEINSLLISLSQYQP